LQFAFLQAICFFNDRNRLNFIKQKNGKKGDIMAGNMKIQIIMAKKFIAELSLSNKKFYFKAL